MGAVETVEKARREFPFPLLIENEDGKDFFSMGLFV